MPRSVPHPAVDIDAAVRRHAAARPDAPAAAGVRTLTWRELDEAADRAAAHLAAQGVGPGDRVGWLGQNGPGHPVVLLAAWRRRAALVPLNWRLPATGLRDVAAALGLKHVVAGGESAAEAAQVGAAFSVLDQAAPCWPDVAPIAPLEADGGDEAVIYFTSGSTGEPKGVPLTRDAVDAMMPYADVHKFDEESRVLIVPPTFHAAGACWTQYCLGIGATLLYPADPSPAGLVRTLAERAATHTILVPTLIRMIVDQLKAEPVPLPALRHIGYGASPITPTLLAEAMETLDSGLCQVYGMTEAGGGLCFLTEEDHLPGADPARLSSAGRPGAGIDLGVRDLLTGEEVPQGTEGELWFRAPSMTLGYLGADPSRGVLVDGWFNSRDMGYVDEGGYVFVRGRSDDMIVTGGENVHPGEVENVIARVPDVADAAVYGVPDPHWGQKVCAAVVLRPGGTATAEAIQDHCRAHLPGYKIPKLLRILPDLPRTATGKTSRPQLVKETLDES
ncbi:fatty acid--CoA ligase [Actinocorallia aurea]